MSMKLIQGFEHVKPTSVAEGHVLAAELANYFGFITPTNTADWFLDSSGGVSNDSGPLIQDSSVNIDGKALVIKRPDTGETNNPLFNGTKAVELAYAFSSAEIAFAGFAVRYDTRPIAPIPLVQFLSDNGTSVQEQCSLWLGTSGQLFFSTVDFDITTEEMITPIADASLLSAQQAFNFDTWNYIEVSLNNTTAPTTLTVAVNNVNVIDNVQVVTGNKTTRAIITSIGIINPQNSYFGGGYEMFLDDMYFGDGNGTANTAITGPQHIILLEPATTSQNEWTITGGEVSSNLAVDGDFDKSDLTDYLTNSGSTDEEIFTLDNLPANVVGITAVQIGAFMDVDAGTAAINLKVTDGGDTTINEVTVNTLAPAFYKGVWQFDAAGDAWTVAALNSTNIAVEVSS